MKSIIIYYSYTGNTKKIAQFLTEYLKQESEMLELEALDEPDSFISQCKRAFWRKRADIREVNFDLGKYDLICFGTPVWAFGPAPSMNTYLDKCLGVEGKEIVLFATYGSGTGRERCLNYMQRILSKKGAGQFRRFSIQQSKVNNKDFVLSQIKETLQ